MLSIPSACVRVWLLLVAVGAAAGRAAAQGTFVNYELPVVRGLAVATVAGETYVIAANPDDDSIAVLHAATDVLTRVAVGMGPVSVTFDPATNRIYTANFLGDSVSMLELLPGQTPVARLLHTEPVADEPTDVSVRPGTDELFVALGSRSELARLKKTTLAPHPYGPGHMIPIGNADSALPQVMKYPWRVLHRPTGEIVILNQRAGSNPALGVPSMSSDLDLVEWDHVGLPKSLQGSVKEGNPAAGTLGTMNLGMALATDGRLFVVGSKARNDIVGEPQLRTAATGFVESHLWLVSQPVSAGSVMDRDLNLTQTGSLVPPWSRVSMPTDVVLDEVQGTVQRVFVTSFGTDRIVTLSPNASAPSAWPSTTTQLWAQSGSGYAMVGPRSPVLATVGGQKRLYVLCRLDASLRRWDVGAAGALSNEVRLQLQDPMGTATRQGQRFLYDARESGNGMTACASCHFDARTDGLAWKLDPPGNPSPGPVPPELLDGLTPGTSIPGDRGPMITQSMQGLTIGLAEPYHLATVQPPARPETVLSTEPFYWRGRRVTFASFADAFVALMGRNLPLSTPQIDAFRDHVFTIHYPPNPEQGIERVYDGSLGPVVAGTSTRTLSSGSGALRGLKLFHNMPLQGVGPFTVALGPLTQGRSCVGCHRLPSGTNGLITEVENDAQPLKSSQLRGLRSREQLLRSYLPFPGAATQYPALAPFLVAPHALLHSGGAAMLDTFVTVGFSPPPASGVTSAVMDDLVRFIRQFDTGTAPIVGVPLAITSANHSGWAQLRAFVLLAQSQAERANCGLAVMRRVNGVTTHHFYDVARWPCGFVDPTDPTSATALPLEGGPGVPSVVPDPSSSLLTGNDLIVFQAVPPGSERRIASPSGVHPVQSNTAAPTVTSVRLVVPDPWKPILELGQNLPPLPGATPGAHAADLPGDFTWQGALAAQPKSLSAQAQFVAALQGQFGVPTLPARRHEAPRRFRVRGSGFRHGAKLRVAFPTDWTNHVYGTAVTFSLHPVRVEGELVWETAVAIPPDVVYAMLCGWMDAPGVRNTWLTGSPSPQALSTAYNSYQITVSNEHPTLPQTSTASQVQLTLE